jgi:EmrB/QacA subfamily drug resistance transporter
MEMVKSPVETSPLEVASARQQAVGRRGRWWALGAIVLSALVLGLDSTIVVTALPTLSAKLGATTDELQWISTAFLLALAGLMIPAGALGDRLGRRRVLMAALAIFGLSSAVASQSATAGSLIVMRAMMGVAGAFFAPMTLAIVPTIFSEEERPRAIAIGGAGMFLGLPLGPLVAGWLLTHYAWGSIFMINVPFALLAVLGAGMFVPDSRRSDAPSLDFFGAALSIAGVTSLVYSIIEQPARGWTDATVVAGLATGATTLAGFAIWELRTRSPLIDLRLFLNLSFTCSILTSMVMSFALMGLLFVFTPLLQVVEGNDAQGTGLRLLPLIAGIVFGAIVSDRLVARLGVRALLVLGLIVCGIGLALMSVVKPGDGYAPFAIVLPVIGIGNAFAMFTSFNVILGVLPASQTGAGSALTRTLGQVGSSFGVAILGSVLNSAYRQGLESQLGGVPVAVREVAEGSVAAAAFMSSHLPPALGDLLLRTSHQAYGDGMSDVMRVSAVVMVFAAILIARLMPGPTRDRSRASARAAIAP